MYLLKKQSASYSPFGSFYRKHIRYATRQFQGQGPNPQTGKAKTCSQSIWLGGKISFQTKNLMKYFVTVKYNEDHKQMYTFNRTENTITGFKLFKDKGHLFLVMKSAGE